MQAEQSSSGWAGFFFFFSRSKILIRSLTVTQAAWVICMDAVLGKQTELTAEFFCFPGGANTNCWNNKTKTKQGSC